MSDPRGASEQEPKSRLEEIIEQKARIEELSDSENEYEDMGIATKEEQAHIAYLESVRIPLEDTLETETSKVQDKTHEVILPFLEGNPNEFPLNIFGIPHLQREKHLAMLKKCLGDYNWRFAVMDTSRPWILYWSLQGMAAMGQDVSEYQKR